MSYGRIMKHPILGEWSEQIGITFRLDDQEYKLLRVRRSPQRCSQTVSVHCVTTKIPVHRAAFIATSDTASNAALRSTG